MFRHCFILVALVCSVAGAATTRQDDSCDIAVTPAATLLLPYFVVDISSPPDVARTTLFSIVNVSPLPQIARVTLWTDRAFPAFSFDLFLTGYDAQSVNLRDLFTTGQLTKTSAGTLPGSLSQSNYANPNHLASMVTDCAQRPESIPPAFAEELRQIFTRGYSTGTLACPAQNGSRYFLGDTHTDVIGYATIDVVATCSARNPAVTDYYTAELLFDNVLTGDFQIISPNPAFHDYAGGSPLVHIRAIPEGGPAGSRVPTNLPYTFYDRLTPRGMPAIDRRQPLPSTFAARCVARYDIFTRYMIWREAYTGPSPKCSEYETNNRLEYGQGAHYEDLPPTFIRFDEHENAFVWFHSGFIILPPPGRPGTAATTSLSTQSSVFPQNYITGDVAGWMFLNLNNMGSAAYSAAGDFRSGSNTAPPFARQSQNWVVVEMGAEGGYNVMYDAAQLANGCSIAPHPDRQAGPGTNATP